MSKAPKKSLEKLLNSGAFAVTAELFEDPSRTPESYLKRAGTLAGSADAVIAGDAAMSSLGAAAWLAGNGHETILRLTCRDRNRIALKEDVRAAAALGVNNVLCLTGPAIELSDSPGTRPVFDLESVTLLAMLKGMDFEAPPPFLGAGVNPFAPPFDYRPHHLAKKVEAGAGFVITHPCFDAPALEEYIKRAGALGLGGKCFIIASAALFSSPQEARRLKESPTGFHMSEAVISRLDEAGDAKLEGRGMCIETINRLRAIEGLSGIHLMAFGQVEQAARIIAETGLR
ncbi:MAG: methylenetetrahydrofolate reductase [Rhodospirillales bacterium]